MKVPAPSLAPILRSESQGRMLAMLFGNPERSYKVSELAAASGMSASTAGREAERARAAGVVTVEELGNTRLVRANLDHPLAEPLTRILVATFGVPAVIAEEFSDLDDAISVMIFGSWAARWHGVTGDAPADIDVLIVGDPSREDADDAAGRAEARLGQSVQVTVRTMEEWSDLDDPFVREVRSRPLVLVLGELFDGATAT